jgi:hypothetical protein
LEKPSNADSNDNAKNDVEKEDNAENDVEEEECLGATTYRLEEELGGEEFGVRRGGGEGFGRGSLGGTAVCGSESQASDCWTARW